MIRTLTIYVLILLSCNTPSAQCQTPQEFTNNLFCGPRCVQKVLKEYGKDIELTQLVREIQSPASQDGATLTSLADALHTRGIYTAAVNLNQNEELAWDYPVIVHLSKRGQNHYVVWLPPVTKGSRVARVWDGGGATARRPISFHTLRTGPILLTSPNPIDKNQMFATPSSKSGTSQYLIVFLSASVFLAAYYAIFFKTYVKTSTKSI
jgi:ABC-type bacteriocin/lantibiotic exporter with double-glycine peptidase domain